MPTRRTLLKTLAAPAIIPGSAIGLNGATPPSDRVNLATIGLGWMGGGHVVEFLKCSGFQYIALVDIDDAHLTLNKARVDTAYGNQNCAAYHAFEEVLARRDIDAVSIAVPDHWHGIIAVSAARAGKDVYCEKPLAHNFQEGLQIVQAAEKFSRIFQTGSWQRSKENFRHACELVRNGYIGKVHTVEVGLPEGNTDFDKLKNQFDITQPPANLWYDRWLGPAPEAPYCAARVHKSWRWNYNYGGGQLMDWVGHHVDIAHWGLGYDSTGPVEVAGVGEFPARDAIWNTATKFKVETKYATGVKMTIAGGHAAIAGGAKWIGDKGWIAVDRGKLEASNPAILTAEMKPSEIAYPKSPGHYQEFIDSVKSRKPTLTPAATALRSATPGWLGNIAMMTGRKLKWNPETMEIIGDAEASKLLGRDMRSPWRL